VRYFVPVGDISLDHRKPDLCVRATYLRGRHLDFPQLFRIFDFDENGSDGDVRGVTNVGDAFDILYASIDS